MIKVLLADDDALFLNRLMNLIDWNENGYEVTGYVSNGADCVKLLAKQPPDILLLDIDMPGKNGVEVTREIYTGQLPVKVLILSNYDTFSFVREAMRYGAYDYLLKHELTADTLLEKLGELSDILIHEKNQSHQISFLTTMAKQQYLHDFLLNADTGTEKNSHIMTMPEFSGNAYCFSLMQITNFILITHFSSTDRKKMVDSILNLMTNLFSSVGNGLAAYLDYGQFAILFSFQTQHSTREIMDMSFQTMQLVKTNIQKIFGTTVLFQNSDVFTDILSLPCIFEKTKMQLEQRPITNADSKTDIYTLTIQEEQRLLNALTSFNKKEIEDSLSAVFSRFTDSSIPLSERLVHQLIQCGIRFQQEQHMQPVSGMEDVLVDIDLKKMTAGQLRGIITDYFCRISKNVENEAHGGFSPHIQKAMLYIRENYDQDITLNDLADYLHVSPSHFSRLFRKETGMSFIDYLVTYRVERARLLMQQTNMNMKTISEKTGFHSYNYFLRVYKQKTGHSPSQDMKHG